MRIVRNEKGLYAIKRKYFMFSEYFDLNASLTRGFWWPLRLREWSKFYSDCFGSKEDVLKAWNFIHKDNIQRSKVRRLLRLEKPVSLVDLVEEEQ